MPIVSVVKCEAYDLDAVRQAVTAVLAPLGGMERFVQPGMQVLLKPNLLSATDLERAVTTHPTVVEAVVEQVQAAGGTALIGDSPAGPVVEQPPVWRVGGMAGVAERTGAALVAFDGVAWKRLNGHDYYIARPVLEADLVINLPKLKTHIFALYTGAVKNLFGVIPGTRKRELHCRAPSLPEFSEVLGDVLALVQPGLTLMDGVTGQEGHGPGPGGTPRRYDCLAASTDGVALDAVITRAMGFRPSEVLHVTQAGARGLGVSDPDVIRVEGDRRALEWGAVDRPRFPFNFRLPTWIGGWMGRAVQLRPQLDEAECAGCGRCAEVCPAEAIHPLDGKPPQFDLDACIGCFCCAEICPRAAIRPRRGLLARLLGVDV
ncbi:MAG TPA: DUF362 domain-containing protein [Chloroflexi bacterium]|nr:DUF362 domain-containing protein [Chloroflexota bacterium]